MTCLQSRWRNIRIRMNSTQNWWRRWANGRFKFINEINLRRVSITNLLITPYICSNWKELPEWYENKNITSQQRRIQTIGLWVLLFITGILIALFANFIHFSIHQLQAHKIQIVNTRNLTSPFSHLVLSQGSHSMGFLVALIWCTGMMVTSGLLVAVIEVLLDQKILINISFSRMQVVQEFQKSRRI